MHLIVLLFPSLYKLKLDNNKIDDINKLKGLIGSKIEKISVKGNPFTIDNANIVFSSNICDIDLYKFRIYDTALSLNDVVTNYAVDLKNVNVYDQNAIAVENNAINEYQNKQERI